MKLVALDIDGTVVDHDDRLSGRVLGAVAEVAAAGVHVVLATGRSVLGTLPVLERLGLHRGWAVCSNGAVVVRLDPQLEAGYEVVHTETFDPADAVALLRGHLPAAMFAVEDVGAGFRLNAPFPPGELNGEVRVVPFEELVERPVVRVIVRSTEHTPQDFLDLVERVGLHGAGYAVGWTAWLDLAPEGVSKASGLERVRAELAVAREDTLAVGDGRNDLEMFAWAGRSVAMGQAGPDVRGAAGEVTGPVEADGVADVLEGLLRDAGNDPSAPFRPRLSSPAR